MTNSAGAVRNGLVLRLSIPASGDIAAVGLELAVKLAEQLGLGAPQAARVGDAVAALARQVDPSGAADLSFEFHKVNGELKIEARQGSRASETRVPLGA